MCRRSTASLLKNASESPYSVLITALCMTEMLRAVRRPKLTAKHRRTRTVEVYCTASRLYKHPFTPQYLEVQRTATAPDTAEMAPQQPQDQQPSSPRISADQRNSATPATASRRGSSDNEPAWDDSFNLSEQSLLTRALPQHHPPAFLRPSPPPPLPPFPPCRRVRGPPAHLVDPRPLPPARPAAPEYRAPFVGKAAPRYPDPPPAAEAQYPGRASAWDVAPRYPGPPTIGEQYPGPFTTPPRPSLPPAPHQPSASSAWDPARLPASYSRGAAEGD